MTVVVNLLARKQLYGIASHDMNSAQIKIYVLVVSFVRNLVDMYLKESFLHQIECDGQH